MRKASLLVLFAILSCGYGPSAVWSAEAPLKIATEGVAPPFNFFKGKELTGFEVELTNEIVHRLGRKPEWLTFNFSALLIGLQQGRYDFTAASHTITAERAKAVDFSDPHYCGGAVVVSKDPKLLKIADLKGKTVSITTGTTYADYVKLIPGLKEAKTFDKQTDGLQTMLSGRVDAWMIDKFIALDVLKTPQGKGLHISELLFPERCAFAVKKGNKALLSSLNQKLAEVLADGTYAKLSQKYFQEDIRCK